MGTRFRFDREKAIEVILYIARRTPDVYKALKILYFADKDHLAEYGRLICGDSYVAMAHGPVPSGAYDLVKAARIDGLCGKSADVTKSFVVQDNGRTIVPQREPNMSLLSKSDIACLDSAIVQYGSLPFGQLKRLSHDNAYRSADQNDFIPIEAIIATLRDGPALLGYIQDP